MTCCASEIEHCTYNFEVADVGRLKQMYDLFEAEAHSALAHNLVIPAHDYVLRCSHTFNLLDARGAIGVTERARFFAACATWRARYRWPMPNNGSVKNIPGCGTTRAGRQPKRRRMQPRRAPVVQRPANYLLEIGTEELPPADLRDALAQLQTGVPGCWTTCAWHTAPSPSSARHGAWRCWWRRWPHAARRGDDVKGPPAERA